MLPPPAYFATKCIYNVTWTGIISYGNDPIHLFGITSTKGDAYIGKTLTQTFTFDTLLGTSFDVSNQIERAGTPGPAIGTSTATVNGFTTSFAPQNFCDILTFISGQNGSLRYEAQDGPTFSQSTHAEVTNVADGSISLPLSYGPYSITAATGAMGTGEYDHYTNGFLDTVIQAN